MSMVSRDAPRLQGVGERSFGLYLFVATSFLSAALLFSIQPMFTKIVLPILGGSASVWSIATVFFQATLLLGYAYAHGLTTWVPSRLVAPIHALVSLAAIAMLPVAIPAGWTAAPERFQSFWLVGLFALAVGLPFFWLSANGPLLQAWYARSGQPGADRPYFLYAASNIGSFAALLAYPLVVEPFTSLGSQTKAWTYAFVMLCIVLAACGLVAQRSTARELAPTSLAGTARSAITWKSRIAWVLLAFVPSGLLVSVTVHISTDVAAVPLLWVVPLALFLLTFVLTFADRSVALLPWLSRLQVWMVAVALIGMVLSAEVLVGIGVHLTTFFVSAMVCHTALYLRRPEARDLTQFYLFMSLGGCLGGIFSAILAPQIFSSVLEYPLLLVLGLFCRPGFFEGGFGAFLRATGRNALIACAVLLAGGLLATHLLPAGAVKLGLVLGWAVVLMVMWRRPSWVAPSAAALAFVACVMSFGPQGQETIRSFFGVHKLSVSPDRRFLTLAHGTTIHGAIRLRNDDGTPVAGRPEPTTYYTYEGGIGSGIAAIREAKGGTLASVAAIGLGSGSLACHRGAKEDWTFFEIDPEILKIARDPRYFRFLSECAPDAPVVLGDARLTIGREAQKEDLIVLDAFSSDSIPAHLLTVEAFKLYRSKLRPNGVLLIHVTNRQLDLTQIVARAASEVGLLAYKIEDRPTESFERRYRSPTKVMALAASKADLGRIATGGDWQEVAPDPSRRPWTDDFSNILEAIADKNGW